MPRNTYTFGDLTFTSKDKVKKYYAAIKNKYGNGDRITDKTDHEQVGWLLQKHVDCRKKIGCGVSYFYVNSAPNHPMTTCFWIKRINGSQTDFGIPACLESPGKLNRSSFRECIAPQIEAFKEARGLIDACSFVSELSQKRYIIDELHVDHKDTTFEEIVTLFCEKEGLDIENELLTYSEDACSLPRWNDPDLGERFADFHSTFPLQAISLTENLSIKKRVDNARLRNSS